MKQRNEVKGVTDMSICIIKGDACARMHAFVSVTAMTHYKLKTGI